MPWLNSTVSVSLIIQDSTLVEADNPLVEKPFRRAVQDVRR
jgi:hypothetical protein